MDSEKQFAGLRVIDGCEPHQILAQIFVEDGKISLSQFYFDSARKTGRHHEEATILLVGHSGHGKSKTINRLIGYSLLEVGRGNNNLGSTTKDVQRVKMPVPQSDPQQPPIILGLDDTPGYGDNTSEDRGTNLALIRLYQERFYSPSIRIPWRRYPNVVLIVTSWNSLTIDAHNAPEKFTSPLGQSMFKVAQAGLVDPQRPNVIVVVTKSLSFMSEFDDYKTQAEKDEQWKIEAGRRRGIITDLQRKLFPKLAQWPIVFIENGGGKHVHHQYPMLPNGELSHQNLFEAIQCVIEGKGNEEASDLAGMQALQLLTGAEPFGKSFEPQKEILVDSTREQVSAVIEEPPISASKTQCSEQAQVLADQFLGVTYHPILGSYGRTTVLKLGASDVGFRKGHGAETYFTQIENLQEEKTATATRLGCDFDVPQLARLSAYYSTSEGVKQAWNNASQLYVAQHLLEQVAVNPL
ncbi:protein hedgehog, partial [Favolaschia claudopus]